MKFGEIIGHQEEKGKLVAMAEGKKLPHAIMLSGPSGVGKMQVARAFVQYLFCTDPKGGDSCGVCPNCLQTAKLNNPDIHYIYPVVKKNKAELSADFFEEWKSFITKNPYMSPKKWLEELDAGNSRPSIYKAESEEVLRLSSLSSYGNGYKVFLVWLPEKMNIDASNRLLKVIEEPFSDTLFILVSNSPSEILPTIRSRVQNVEFKPLSGDEVVSILRRTGKYPEDEEVVKRIAQGDVNKAFAFMETGGENSLFTEMFIRSMRGAYSRQMPELKTLADTFAGYGREKSLRLLDYFARMVRESFISNLRCAYLENMTAEERKFVDRFGPFINATNVEEISTHIDKAKEDISRNANQKIVWFDFLIELTRLIRTNLKK